MGTDRATEEFLVHGVKYAFPAKRGEITRGLPTLLDATEEFLVHGVKYAFPAKRGEITRGLPTSYAAPPLKDHIVGSPEWPPVWPFPEGHERGASLEPLYKTVPLAASRDSELYEWLVLIDGLREGRSRERRFAAEEVARRLRQLR